MGIKVPKLMLQPLVENSLYHGLRPMGTGGVIVLSGWKEDNKLVIEVRDTGVGMKDQAIQRVFDEANNLDKDLSSIGLPATIRRIKFYDKNSKIHIDNSIEGTCIHIELSTMTQGVHL